ncbi:MAG: hypothetical protein LBQ89_09195 [Treponema sp.]|jgi:hypothetical protein|nr:hypothetical protein [Treponema sp.]
MTLSERNTFFKIGIAFCAVSTLLLLAASFLVVPVYQTMEENTRRPSDLIHILISRFLDVNYIAVHSSVVMAVLFSITGIILIYSFFEQTPAPEILYVVIFTLSFSFETIRILLPLHFIFDIPSFYMLMALRVLLFARYFSILSLFAASVCAAGLEVQKTVYIIIIIFIATLVIVFSAPIDTQNWDTSLNMINGNTYMFRLIEAATFLTTVISFFVAANIRGSKDYKYIGIGIMLALIGRFLLLSADNWITPVPGILLLSIGIWFVCSRLHKIHLWL